MPNCCVFLNSLLGNSRATIKEAKAILQQTATRMLGIQRDEAYASAVLIQLVNGLGGRPDYGIEPTDDIAGGAGLASRLALFGRDQIRLADELESNLRRVADDRIRHRLQKLLKARVPNFRRLDGKPHLALAQTVETDPLSALRNHLGQAVLVEVRRFEIGQGR